MMLATKLAALPECQFTTAQTVIPVPKSSQESKNGKPDFHCPAGRLAG